MINGELEKSRGKLSKNYFYIQVEDYIKVYNRDASKELNPKKAETKILVYEDRINSWFLDVLDGIRDDPDAGFAILECLIACIENNQMLRGNSSLASAIERIFNIKNASALSKQIKSGGFGPHNKLSFSINGTKAIDIREDTTEINPGKFIDAVRRDLNFYVAQLKSNSKMRATFERNFKLL